MAEDKLKKNAIEAENEALKAENEKLKAEAEKWKKEFTDKQNESEQLVAMIEEQKHKPVVEQLVHITNEFLGKLKEVPL